MACAQKRLAASEWEIMEGVWQCDGKASPYGITKCKAESGDTIIVDRQPNLIQIAKATGCVSQIVSLSRSEILA